MTPCLAISIVSVGYGFTGMKRTLVRLEDGAGCTARNHPQRGRTSMTTATTTAGLSAGTWTIDPVHSSIGFWVRHLMVSKVRGTFGVFSGTIAVGDDGVPSVNAEITVDSVNTNNEQRDAHIKSADFFAVED